MTIKFQIQKRVNNLSRLGLISEINGFEKSVETPATLLFTKFGTFPFLTPDLVDKIKYLPEIVQCPLNYIADKLDVLEKFNNDLATFMGYKGSPVFITQSDSSSEDFDGGVTKDTISAWCIGGRCSLTLKDYFRVIKTCKPFMWQAPCDIETPVKNPSEKRLQKAVERTISFLNSTRTEIQSQELPGNCLTSFTGGNNWLRRRQCLERMLTPEMPGFILDGFHGIANSCEETVTESLNLVERINGTIREFDDVKLVMLPKFNQPSQVVRAVKRGVDLFDGSFPYLLTIAKVAWVYTSFSDAQGDVNSGNQWVQLANDSFENCLDLPIDPHCDCFACSNHTRGYINHLIKTKELLADILLIMHNSTQYYKFFHEMRQAMANDRFDAFHDWAITIECPQQLLGDVKMC